MGENPLTTKLRELDNKSYNQLIVYALLAVVEIPQSSFPTMFLMKVFRCEYFLHNAFHVGVRQRSPKLILHAIPDVYPHANFMNKRAVNCSETLSVMQLIISHLVQG